MKLGEAFELANGANVTDAAPKVMSLVCGFTPLHLVTFLKAYGSLRFPESGLGVITGLYGDLVGNLERAVEEHSEVAVLIEWADLDARLGLRNAVGCTANIQRDILAEVERQFARLSNIIRSAADGTDIVLTPPTLALPPLGHTTTAQSSPVELQLQRLLTNFLAQDFGESRFRVVNTLALASVPDRLDAKMALSTGFPYTLAHTDSLSKVLIDLLFPKPAKKALITDLDGTLWKGILGEVGVEGLSWHLSSNAQLHSLYQQTIAALAENGVLAAVASKNDPELAAKALQCSDLLIGRETIFPIEANWEPKFLSIARILKTWNISASDAVFVDDSPMELEEVQLAFPEITCLLFPATDAAAFLQLVKQLRDMFGKPSLAEEDRIRTASLRSTAEINNIPENPLANFLEGLKGAIAFDHAKDPDDSRPLDLINKTNQFNLNGRRYTKGEWAALLKNPDTFLVTASYKDKFGPLGRIAVVLGTVEGQCLRVTNWVMSCRAFSRRIEHHTLALLFGHWQAKNVIFEFERTERNGPLQSFFAQVTTPLDSGNIEISREKVAEICTSLPHAITEIENGKNIPAA
jgi:FkbH-like protein